MQWRTQYLSRVRPKLLRGKPTGFFADVFDKFKEILHLRRNGLAQRPPAPAYAGVRMSML